MNSSDRTSNAPKTPSSANHNVYHQGGNAETISLNYKVHEAQLRLHLHELLDDWGLAARLQEAIAQGQKLKLLNISCSEGLYLHYVAEILESRGLLAGADLYGIDSNVQMIATADEYHKVSKPPRPYLKFFLHDYQQPLSANPALQRFAKTSFDVILFGIYFMAFTPNSKTILQRIYTENLNQQGLLSFREIIVHLGEDSFIVPHEVMTKYYESFSSVLINSNNGERADLETGHWLKEWGAEPVKQYGDTIPLGGPTQEGQLMLKHSLATARFVIPNLIAAGLLPQGFLDHMMQVLYTELTPQMVGQEVHNTFIAQKP